VNFEQVNSHLKLKTMYLNNKIISKFSNYNEYVICGITLGAKKLEEQRLMNAIESCRKMLKKPYIRFILHSLSEEPECFVYDNGEKVTRLLPISQIEQMIEEGKFHK
jgi:hypothetical protein